ncbi:hypothetical protein Q1695_012671 [Nippostrongylus brasiliensis]|nr:hypothetical protein Q1695_012671 [Nippostrongylus brasiliensis]
MRRWIVYAELLLLPSALSSKCYQLSLHVERGQWKMRGQMEIHVCKEGCAFELRDRGELRLDLLCYQPDVLPIRKLGSSGCLTHTGTDRHMECVCLNDYCNIEFLMNRYPELGPSILPELANTEQHGRLENCMATEE